MKQLLALSLLGLLLTACSSEPVEDDSSLLDMYEDGEELNDTEELNEEDEVPYSEGPMEIPDDLVLPEDLDTAVQ